jgi:GNAT superfamily N-acetyltransferase
LQFITFDQWNDELWQKVLPIYEHAFAGKGAKPEKIIINMFRKHICYLHVGLFGDDVVAMALTGGLKEIRALLIDYLAVAENFQNQGLGREMVDHIKEWCLAEGKFESIVLETEAEDTPENLARIHFWGKCGFTLTDYIHLYIWVPETYRAMFVKLVPNTDLPENGEDLFRYIGEFHKTSFQSS